MKPTTSTSIVSPEAIVPKKKYTYTLSPDDDHQYWKCTDRIDKLQEFMLLEILRYPNVDIVAKMEVSRTGRLHYHGTISFLDKEAIKHFFVIAIHDILKFSQLEIDTIADEDKWNQYIAKQDLFNVWLKTSEALKKFQKIPVYKKSPYQKCITDY